MILKPPFEISAVGADKSLRDAVAPTVARHLASTVIFVYVPAVTPEFAHVPVPVTLPVPSNEPLV